MKKSIAIIFALCMVTIGLCQDRDDVEGSKDHPVISRFKDSYIVNYNVKDFDEYKLILGKIEGFTLTKSKKVEGKIARIIYKASKGVSTYEVLKAYEKVLKQNGFQILYIGTSDDLGVWYYNIIMSNDNIITLNFDCYKSFKEERQITAKLEKQSGNIYLSLGLLVDQENRPIIFVNIIEEQPLKDNLVTVSAESFAKDIENTSHASVYGILFDTGKAELKPESEPTLKEINKLLRNNLKLNLYVVGHTDNVGTYEYNMELSKNRSNAVVEELISKYNIDAKRLFPLGVGPVSPVSTNKTEEGKAKNRRVELVEQ